MNIGVVLAYDYLIAPNTWLGYVLGAVQLAAAGLTAFTAVRLSLGARPLTLPGRRAKPVHMAKEAAKKRSARRKSASATSCCIRRITACT